MPWLGSRRADTMSLPVDLLHAIAADGGGRVVLVLGAGASVERPTGLPLASQCAQKAHRDLLADGVLSEGQCASPDDLSLLADTVADVTGGQSELVERLPVAQFRSAEPNDGSLIAAALLREQAVACVLTLNFDLSMSTALAQIGAGNVAIVPGPEAHHHLGTTNLIYLHRNVDADPESWVLRTAALDEEWRNRWEEVVAQKVIAGSVTVFAGLGSPAAVLVESTRRIREALPNGTTIFQVDPGEKTESGFSAALGIQNDDYLQMTWCEFATELGARLVTKHQHELSDACEAMIEAEGWDDEDSQDLCRRIAGLGLVDLGKLRARWTLDSALYAPSGGSDVELIVDLLLGIGVLERATGTTAVFDADGVVELHREGSTVGSVIVASGRGVKRWFTLEAEIGQHEHRRRSRPRPPAVALVGGVQGAPTAPVAPPVDIATESDEQSIVTGGESGLTLVSVDDLRFSVEDVAGMVA